LCYGTWTRGDSHLISGHAVAVDPDPNDLKSIPPEDRKRLEVMGEAYVRQVMSMPGGLPYPLGLSATRWLAEIDENTRKSEREAEERNEAHQAEQSRLAKSTLRAAWIAAGLAAAGIFVTIWLSYIQDQTAKAEVAHNKMIKDGIGQYIGEGSAIMNRFAANEMPMPTMDEVGWVGRTEDFLRTNLCESYVSRFHDNSGLAPIQANGADGAHNREYVIMYHEITRLEEFSHEIPSC
jgi:hypothetical protein